MPSSTLLKASATVVLSGVTGHSQWKGMVVMKSNQESLAVGFHTQAWTNISCEKPAYANWALCMTFQTNYHSRPLRKSSTPSFKSVGLWYSHGLTFLTSYLDPACEFSFPKDVPLESKLQNSIEGALASRFNVGKKVIQNHLKLAEVGQWGRVRITDPDTDDTIWAAALRPTSEDQREASYIRVCAQDAYLRQQSWFHT